MADEPKSRRPADAPACSEWRQSGRIAGLTGALVLLAWLAPMLRVRFWLLASGTLTSDLAYYQNMLYNTGWSSVDHAWRFLYSLHDVLWWDSPTFLTEHFSPTLALLAPLFRLVPHPVLLITLQPVLIAVAGWGVHRLSQTLLERGKCSDWAQWLAPVALAAYLWNDSNITATVDVVYGFHHDSLIPPLLVWSLVWALRKRWRVALVLFSLFLGLKENLPIATAAGLLCCLVTNRVLPRRQAAVALALCGLFFVGCYFAEINTGNRHVAIARHFLDWDAIDRATDRLGRWNILWHHAPALLVPAFGLPALADLSLQLIGDTTPLDWHGYPVMLFSQIGAVWAVTWAMVSMRLWPRLRSTIGLVYLGFFLLPMIAGGVQAMRGMWMDAARLPSVVDLRSLGRLRAAVPDEATLCTSSDLLVFVSARARLMWPESVASAEYVLCNRRTREKNEAMARAYRTTLLPPAGRGSSHFRANVDVVLRGYPYDEALQAYMDRMLAERGAKVVGEEGSLVLYRMTSAR